MTRLSIALVAAGLLLLTTPTMNAPAAADPAIKVGSGGVKIKVDRGHRHYARNHRDRHCSKKVIIRNGSRTVIKRCR